VLGVRVDDVTNAETLVEIERLIDLGGPAQVVTVNPEFVMAARRDPAFRSVIEHAALALPDGAYLRVAARLAGDRLRERVAGVDTCLALAGMAAARGWSLYLLGAAAGVAEAAAARLKERHPELRVAGCWAGSPDEAAAPAIVARVQASGADVLLVAYGAPAQDLWLARHLGATGARLGMGVGGAFDFISGRVSRAPVCLQRAGLEWLYRLVRQPWRWRRQLVLPRFLLLALRQTRRNHRRPRRRASPGLGARGPAVRGRSRQHGAGRRGG
jgi:N-acetylglucosaminyldiphosphoundecaprenol N-acetyl-beta-D-mannosaminyltransferase